MKTLKIEKGKLFSPIFLTVMLFILSLSGCMCDEPSAIPPSSGDNWSFLPGYKPNESVYEEGQPKPPAEVKSTAEQIPNGAGRRIFGSFGTNGNESRETQTFFPHDSNLPQTRDLTDHTASPIENPKPSTESTPKPAERNWKHYFGGNPKFSEPEQNNSSKDATPKEAAPLTEPAAPKFLEPKNISQLNKPASTNFIDSFKDREIKEIDHSKYGSFTVWDAQTGLVSVHNPKTGEATTFIDRHDVHFGDPLGGTQAITSRDGKVVHEDFYNHYGDLIRSTSIDPATGIRTSTIYNPDGSTRMERTHTDGTPVVNKASTTNKDTGVTTTAEGNPDGTRTVTKTDQNGNVIDQNVAGRKDSQVLIEGNSTDPKTGINRTGKRLSDGTTEITITDKNGKVIGIERRNASGKLISNAPPASSDIFGRFDAFKSNSLSQVSGSSTPTAALDGSLARNMSSDTMGNFNNNSNHLQDSSQSSGDYSD